MDKDAKPRRERSGQVQISTTDGVGFNWVPYQCTSYRDLEVGASLSVLANALDFSNINKQSIFASLDSPRSGSAASLRDPSRFFHGHK